MSEAASARYPVDCRRCAAAIGQPCRSTLTRRVTDTHTVRITDAASPRRVYEAVVDSLTATFEAALAERPQRQQWSEGADGRREPGWVAHERETMRAAVNRLRAVLRRNPVEDIDFDRAESMAVGHIDYVRKFTLYCADLVVD